MVLRYFRPGLLIIDFQSEMNSASFKMTISPFWKSLQGLLYKSEKELFRGARMTVLNVRAPSWYSDDQHIFFGFASELVLIVLAAQQHSYVQYSDPHASMHISRCRHTSEFNRRKLGHIKGQHLMV